MVSGVLVSSPFIRDYLASSVWYISDYWLSSRRQGHSSRKVRFQYMCKTGQLYVAPLVISTCLARLALTRRPIHTSIQ